MKLKRQKSSKVATIIGAGGNIGSTLCDVLAKEGYTIDKNWIGKNHPDATVVSSYSDLPPKIDLAVYLAGINMVVKTEDLSEDQWDHVLNVNLRGAFLFAQRAFPSLKAAKGSTFVTISSIMVTHPYPNRLAYTVSKAGLEALTRSLAVEWGKYKIYTHCIRLGHLTSLMKSTRTNPLLLEAVRKMTPSKDLISPMDVSKYILWLANGGSKSVSGGVIDFDPAYTINRWPL